MELSETVYALDSTTIDLCLSLFPWAENSAAARARVKLHTLLDLRGSIPTNVYVTGGQVHDVNILDQLLPEAGAFYLLDRGYVDFARLYVFAQAAPSSSPAPRRISVLPSQLTPRRTIDRIAMRPNHSADRSADCPALSRSLAAHPLFRCREGLATDLPDQQFPPSCFDYRPVVSARWQVELFFRWIKQHLRIKAFYGTSENAVKTQVWVAISVYVLVAIVKKQLGLDLSLYKILQILSVTIFEKTPILQGFSNFSEGFADADSCIQLSLFDF